MSERLPRYHMQAVLRRTAYVRFPYSHWLYRLDSYGGQSAARTQRNFCMHVKCYGVSACSQIRWIPYDFVDSTSIPERPAEEANSLANMFAHPLIKLIYIYNLAGVGQSNIHFDEYTFSWKLQFKFASEGFLPT